MDKSGNTEVKRILNIFKRKAALTIFIVLAFVMLGYMYSYYYVVPKYQATETLLLIPNNAKEEQMITTSDLVLNSELISTYSNIAKQSIVLKQVIQKLNLNMTEKELLNKIKVNAVGDTYVIEVSVTDVNPQRATEIAKELSNVFLKEIKQIYNLENIGIVDEAEIPATPYNINHIKDIVMFGILGMFASGIVVICYYLFDNTIKTEEEIEEYINLKTLGKIPTNISKTGEIVNKENSKSYVTECINTIRTNILYMNSVKNAKTILVTSCLSQEGKSFTSSNIAAAFAETNKNVLIIDADMRKGRLNKIFNLDKGEGLSNYLYAMTENIKENLNLAKKYIKETKIPNLHILPNGTIPPNPAELVDSKNMKNLLEMLKEIYDIIIIDSPPCMLVTDSIILSTIADSTILVVNSETTKIKNLLEVKKSIKIVGGNLIGVILNKVKTQSKTYGKSYYYGHNKEGEKCKIKQREIISVQEVIENAIPKFEAKDYDITVKDIKNEEEVIVEENNVEKLYNIQNKNIEKLIETIADIKVQLNRNDRNDDRRVIKTEQDINNVVEVINSKLEEHRENNILAMKEELQAVNYESKINHISKEIKGLNHLDRLNEIYNELEKVKDIFKETDNKMEVENAIGKIYNEIRVIKENHKQLTNEVVTKEEIAEIVRKEIRVKDEKQNITKEDIENIVRYASSRNTQSNDDGLTIKLIQGIVKKELSSIDYTKQINQIQEMLEMLKDNYLELSNRINKDNIEEEINTSNSNNVVSINLFRKDKKKKKAYSIYEDILYSELEETAACIVPFATQEGFNGKVASK